MAHTRYFTANFGKSRKGLATAGYALAGARSWSPAIEVLTPSGNGTGIYGGLVTLPDGYAGPLLWTTDTAEGPTAVYAEQDINPGTDEYVDGRVGGVAAGVWANTSRTLTGFNFPVVATVSGYASGQDPATLVLDCSASAHSIAGSVGYALGHVAPTGPVLVDHNYGGIDALRFVDGTGAGIASATILAYLKSDWDAGSRDSAHIKGQASTGSDGRWLQGIPLQPNTYELAFFKLDAFQTSVTVVVT